MNRIVESPKAAANAHIHVKIGEEPSKKNVFASTSLFEEALMDRPMAEAVKRMLFSMMMPYLLQQNNPSQASTTDSAGNLSTNGLSKRRSIPENDKSEVEMVDVKELQRKQAEQSNEKQEWEKSELLNSEQLSSSQDIPASKITMVDGISVVPTVCSCNGVHKPKLLVTYAKPEEELCKICNNKLGSCVCSSKKKEVGNLQLLADSRRFNGVDLDDLTAQKRTPSNVEVYLMPLSAPRVIKRPTLFSLSESPILSYGRRNTLANLELLPIGQSRGRLIAIGESGIDNEDSILMASRGRSTEQALDSVLLNRGLGSGGIPLVIVRSGVQVSKEPERSSYNKELNNA